MTALEAAKRNEKAQYLNTWQVDDTCFYVESEDGKIAYKCFIDGQGDAFCNCGDFAQRSKNDPNFKCKHLLAVMNSEIIEAKFLEKRKPKLDERFIKTIDGKDFALYSGLLDLAHQKNLISMEADVIQYPSKENDHTAVCKAIAKTATGGLFIDVGDANPMNCNAKVSKHIIRMASTRAKARCLRDLTNIGMTCLEELGDLNEVSNDEDKTVQPKKEKVIRFPEKQVKAAPETKTVKPEKEIKEVPAVTQTAGQPITGTPAETNPPQAKKPGKSGNGNGKDKTAKMSEAQKNAIFNLSRRRGISVEELDKLSLKTFNMPMENLSSPEAASFIRTIQQSA